MKLTTNLESMRGAISACLRCSGCTYGQWPENHSFCPLYDRGQTFTASAGGLLYLAKAILSGQFDYTEELADLVYTCAACAACDGKCVIVRCINPEMALSDILRLIRYEVVKRGLLPKGPIKRMYEQVKKNGDLAGNGGARAMKAPTDVENGRAGTLMVADCLHSKAAVESYDAALSLLGKMKKSVALFTDPGCCGSTLYDFGFWDELPALVEKKWAQIAGYGKRKLLFINPHCQEFITNKYGKIIDGLEGVKGQHFSELLQKAFTRGELTGKKRTKVRVSYHDPCFLGRGLGIYDAPRRVLAGLKGVELIEMKRNRENSFCCGARALGSYFEDFSGETARERIDEFLDTRADVLITACPYCKETFSRSMGPEAHRVKDLNQFVNERV